MEKIRLRDKHPGFAALIKIRYIHKNGHWAKVAKIRCTVCLVGVEKADLVWGGLPAGVNAEGVRVAQVLARVLRVQHKHSRQHQRFLLRGFKGHVGVPVRAEDVEGFREYVIVDETFIGRKERVKRKLLRMFKTFSWFGSAWIIQGKSKRPLLVSGIVRGSSDYRI